MLMFYQSHICCTGITTDYEIPINTYKGELYVDMKKYKEVKELAE